MYLFLPEVGVFGNVVTSSIVVDPSVGSAEPSGTELALSNTFKAEKKL